MGSGKGTAPPVSARGGPAAVPGAKGAGSGTGGGSRHSPLRRHRRPAPAAPGRGPVSRPGAAGGDRLRLSAPPPPRHRPPPPARSGPARPTGSGSVLRTRAPFPGSVAAAGNEAAGSGTRRRRKLRPREVEGVWRMRSVRVDGEDGAPWRRGGPGDGSPGRGEARGSGVTAGGGSPYGDCHPMEGITLWEGDTVGLRHSTWCTLTGQCHPTGQPVP